MTLYDSGFKEPQYFVHYSSHEIQGDFNVNSVYDVFRKEGPGLLAYWLTENPYFMQDIRGNTTEYCKECFHVYEVDPKTVVEPITLPNYDADASKYTNEMRVDFLLNNQTLRDWFEVGKVFLNGYSLWELIDNPISRSTNDWAEEALGGKPRYEDLGYLQNVAFEDDYFESYTLGERSCYNSGFPYSLNYLVNQCCILNPTEVTKIVDRFSDAGFKWIKLESDTEDVPMLGYDRKIRPVEVIKRECSLFEDVEKAHYRNFDEIVSIIREKYYAPVNEVAETSEFSL